MHFFRFAFAVATVLTMSCADSASPPLTGQWGGDRVRLTLDAAGGRIEYDCGEGTIDVPVRPAADGAFAVSGKHEEYASGPTTADRPPSSVVASYRGRVDPTALTERLGGSTANCFVGVSQEVRQVRNTLRSHG